MSGNRRGFLAGLLVGVAGAMAAAAAIVALVGPDTSDSLNSEAQRVIQDNYFKSVSGTTLDHASVNGMVDQLRHRYGDRFSHYFDPHSLAQFDQATSGRFSGVGLSVTEVKRGLRVANVLPETPAEHAGIRTGDVIVAVDGRSIAGVPSQISTARIKGPPGSDVTLRIASAGSAKTHSVKLERADVRVPAVHGDIRHSAGQKVAYVQFATFSDGAHGELQTTLENLYRRGAKGLVLDMRGNGGGLLNEAVLCASLFLPKGASVVSTDSRTMGHTDYTAVGDELEAHPTVVLINHDSASATEILTAALEDHHVATTVGTRSYGKGTFQEVIHLDAGGALDLTVGQFLAANGESLLGKGIKPDVHAPDDPKTPGDEGLRAAMRVMASKLNR